MTRTLTLLAVVLTTIFRPGGLEAQDRSRISVAPMLGPTWYGHRYELEGGGLGVEAELGPSTGLELGLAVEVRPWQRVGLAFTGSWTDLEYIREFTAGTNDGQRDISGDQDVVRLTGGIRYRIVPEAPGFFSAGILMNRFSVGTPALISSEEDRTEFGGFAGLGLDIGGGDRHLRAEGRLMVMAPGADPVRPRNLQGTFEPRSTVVDYSLNLAFVFAI